MKRFIIISILFVLVLIPILLVEASSVKKNQEKAGPAEIQIESEPNLNIHEGYVSQEEETVIVKQGEKTVATIHLSKPVMVAQAEQKEKWGFFQFPSIGIAENGTLIVSWKMAEDTYQAHGTKSGRERKPMMSKDGGLTWLPQNKEYFAKRRSYNVYMRNGDMLQVNSPGNKNIHSYVSFPKAVAVDGNQSFYKHDSLPEDLQGIYFDFKKKGEKTKKLHAQLRDTGLLRYALDSLMRVVWWGSIKELSDNSLIAGVYPTFYQDNNGNISKGGVTFYRSQDEGNVWSVIGRIPFMEDEITRRNNVKSFEEPDFEILSDSTIVCVMRTGDTSPMYQCLSNNLGESWTRPKPFTPNGVKPRMLLLKNGVLALVSGRPGIQLRCCFDGKGDKWSEPIEMIPFVRKNGRNRVFLSCGYASIQESGINSFYLVYSDFTTKNKYGKERKSIWFRNIEVTPSN